MTKKTLNNEQQKEQLETLKKRFEENIYRHKNTEWNSVEEKLIASPDKLWSIYQMEITGGEPDVIEFGGNSDRVFFVDCAEQSPKGRRSLCYDKDALDSRKKSKPDGDAMSMAEEMGIEVLTEEQYRELQMIEPVDTKTSSWLKTPENIRELGGAIFGDRRFDTVFIYHNGVESYYSGRGFRGLIEI